MPDTTAIAIDGPGASGKTAVGRLLAERLGYRFLDTGSMYRTVTFAALERGLDLEDQEALTCLSDRLDIRLIPGDAEERVLADGQDVTDRLRSADVERRVSLVASVPGVRAGLVERQRRMAREGPIVMVGRDIGTVVLPGAGLKVFLTASAEVRARRRLQELGKGGRPSDHAKLVEEFVLRDTTDSNRADSPLRPAEDAVQIETGDMSVDEVVEAILSVGERSWKTGD